MKHRANRLARLALLTALGVVLLIPAALIPTARLAFLAIASFPVCAALMTAGPGWSAGVFAVTAAAGLLLFPGTVSVGYAVFFGWYPIVKSLCERIHGRWGCLGAKILVYSAAFAAGWFLASGLFPAADTAAWCWLYPAGLAVFLVFDWAYSLLIRFYLDRLARFLT